MRFGPITVSSPTMVVGAAGTVHPIDTTPRMPDLRIEAPFAEPIDARIRRFRLEITYDDGRRFDHVQVPPDAPWQEVAGPVWAPELGGVLAGGDLVAFAEIDLPDGMRLSADSGPGRHRVLGLNPARHAIRDRLGNATALAVVIHRASRFTQFQDGPGAPDRADHDPAGPRRAVAENAIGYGVGALRAPRATDLWDWTANLAAAVAGLRALRADALAYQRQMQTAYPDAPALTDDEMDREMFARLDDGPRYHDYRPAAGGWARRAPTGPGDAALRRADELAELTSKIAAGDVPAGWE